MGTDKYEIRNRMQKSKQKTIIKKDMRRESENAKDHRCQEENGGRKKWKSGSYLKIPSTILADKRTCQLINLEWLHMEIDGVPPLHEMKGNFASWINIGRLGESHPSHGIKQQMSWWHKDFCVSKGWLDREAAGNYSVINQLWRNKQHQQSLCQEFLDFKMAFDAEYNNASLKVLSWPSRFNTILLAQLIKLMIQ